MWYYISMTAEDITNRFLKTLNDLENPQGEFFCADLAKPDFCLIQDYPRRKFILDVENVLKNLSENQKTNITGLFGFVLDKNIDFISIKGYSSALNLDKEGSLEYKKVFALVEKFVNENRITVKNYPSLSRHMNIIAKALPEFLTTIGKIQHHTHSYTVDIHTLKVLQGVIQNPQYPKLPQNDRYALQISVLLHDITKKEGEIDKSHPACSARDAGFILNKLNIPLNEKSKICLLIRHHDWLERYNKGITTADEFADILKEGNIFKMLCIFAEADLKAVQRDGGFYEKYKDVLQKGIQEIGSLISHTTNAA